MTPNTVDFSNTAAFSSVPRLAVLGGGGGGGGGGGDCIARAKWNIHVLIYFNLQNVCRKLRGVKKPAPGVLRLGR